MLSHTIFNQSQCLVPYIASKRNHSPLSISPSILLTYVPYPPPPPPPRKHKNTFNRKESTHLNQFELLYNKDTKQVIETTNQLNIPHSLFFTNTNPQTQKPDSFRQVRWWYVCLTFHQFRWFKAEFGFERVSPYPYIKAGKKTHVWCLVIIPRR